MALRAKLPPGWRVDIEDAPPEFDEILAVSSPTATAVRFAVEAKNSARVSVDQIVNKARAGSYPVLFVAEYVNAPLRRECEARAISYLDTTGWAYVVHDDPPVLIRTEGASGPPRPRESAHTARLNGPAAGRAIRCLLELDPPVGIRELATRASTSPAAVSKLMPTLGDAGAVDRSRDGVVTRIRRRTLLDRWTADYSFLKSNGVVLDYLAPRGLAGVLERIRQRDDMCVTGSAAGRTYLPSGVVPVIPLGLLAVYTADAIDLAEQLGLVRTDRSVGNVMITTPRDPELLRSPRLSEQGLPVAPVGQVLADLLTLPGRMAQEAEQIMEVLAEKDQSWRE